MVHIWLLKLLGSISRLLSLGSGSTWPGHIMLGLNPSFLKQFDKKYNGKIIVIAGTNGKTTTSKMIRTILERDGETIIHNEAGANLLNGIASSIINATRWNGNLPNTAIFEVDENTLPLLTGELTPDILVILNLFRDQLDRYGEVNTIALKWKKALEKLPKQGVLLLNEDDTHVAYLGKNVAAKVTCFGLDNKTLYLSSRPHAMDAVYCPNCEGILTFEGIYLGHLGKWHCDSCGLRRPDVAYKKELRVLPGIYNLYNSQAAFLVAKTVGVTDTHIESALKTFAPAFGRQEEFSLRGKKAKILLSKNPTGFNESLRTIKELGAKHVLIVLNDRIPDGRDVSWIWDVDFEGIADLRGSIGVAGDRVYDIALRLKYTGLSLPQSQIYADLKKGIEKALQGVPRRETLYILPTYSAMLEVRKILGGRKIL